MSIRYYSPRRNRRRGISLRSQISLNLTLGIAILLQIAYPLLDGEKLRIATISIVYWGAAAMALHALLTYGHRFLWSYLAITVIFSFTIETIGVKTGWPFGIYQYDISLGPQLGDVPIVVPFAWVMMSYPMLIVARRVSQRWVFLYGGVGLSLWDLFLDPQMVDAGRWRWTVEGRTTPFVSEIPLSNTFGWLFTGMVLMSILHIALPREKRKVGPNLIPVDIFLLWTGFSGVVGNLFFFDRPGVALFAGILYFAFLSPYFFSRWLGRP